MEEIKKILEALEKGDEKLLLSDVVSSNFTKGCKDINDLHKQIQDKLRD